MSEVMRADVSDVIITFIDGTSETYRISATISVNGYLIREAGEHGILGLYNHTQSWAIPVAGIRSWTIKQVPFNPEEK